MQLDYGVQERPVLTTREMSRGAWGCCPRGMQLRGDIIFAVLCCIFCQKYPSVLCLEKAQNGCGTWDYKSTAIAAEV